MEQEIKYLEKKYHEYRRDLWKCYQYLWDIENNTFVEEIDEDRKEYSKYWTYDHLFRMYNIICAYLELMKLDNYLSEFKRKFNPIISDRDKALEFSSIPLEDGRDYDDDFSILIEWNIFLSPFDIFDNHRDVKHINRVVKYLESTNEILKFKEAKITNEEGINRIMREVSKFYFDGVVTYSQGYFTHQFKNYKPDIIIKEFGVAVEYKLIRKEKDIGTKLGELADDAKGYTGNYMNKYCIAVFCLSRSIHKTKKEIREGWKMMRFPKNWILIIITDVEIHQK